MRNVNYTTIYKAIRKCYSDQSSDAWTKKAVNLWNKGKEDSCGDLNELKAEVGVITKKIYSEHCWNKVTASNKKSVELNTLAGKDDYIIATSISEVLPLPQSPRVQECI